MGKMSFHQFSTQHCGTQDIRVSAGCYSIYNTSPLLDLDSIISFMKGKLPPKYLQTWLGQIRSDTRMKTPDTYGDIHFNGLRVM